MAMGEPSSRKSYFDKVFCDECRYLKVSKAFEWDTGEIEYICQHPHNLKSPQDTWLKRGPNLRYHHHPSKLNKKNNCTWYTKKPLPRERGGGGRV